MRDEDEITESKKPRYDVRIVKAKERKKKKIRDPQKRREKEIRKEATNCNENGEKRSKIKAR